MQRSKPSKPVESAVRNREGKRKKREVTRESSTSFSSSLFLILLAGMPTEGLAACTLSYS
ncbi:unnamed protein product [Musa acuminata subsp. burmannicoides]